MNIPQIILFFALFSSLLMAKAQDSTKKISFLGYTEMYYSYDFARPSNHEKSDFLYNHKRHNEMNLNLLLAKATYEQKNLRANVGIMFGNYPQYNLATEPNWAKFLYEANVGTKLSSKHNLWFDAGIMPSHLGFESAISSDCWTLTRSLCAENSPYYETGAKVTYSTKNNHFSATTLILNGWQHIQRPESIQKPSLGVQLIYKPNDRFCLNYSNFIGTDKPDSLKIWRNFHNLYAIYEPNSKWGMIAGFDIGADKDNAQNYNVWYTPILILRYAIAPKYKIAARAEYYHDKKQVIIATNTANGFQVWGLSGNIDYQLNSLFSMRIEGKMYHSKDAIFNHNKHENYSITTSMNFNLKGAKNI